MVTSEAVLELGWYFSGVIRIENFECIYKVELSSIPRDLRVISLGVLVLGCIIIIFALCSMLLE